VAYANKGSCDDVGVDVGNWDNQEGYDEERADNEVGNNARRDVNASKNKAKMSGKSKKRMNRKKFVCCRKVLS
jgi:hypothetical protein